MWDEGGTQASKTTPIYCGGKGNAISKIAEAPRLVYGNIKKKKK